MVLVDGDPSNDTKQLLFLFHLRLVLHYLSLRALSQQHSLHLVGQSIILITQLLGHRSTAAAKTGSGSMFMDNWDYTANGEVDWIDLPAL